MQWPNDSDGDVFRRLEAGGLDFSVPKVVDYDVDFKAWPPHPEAIIRLRELFASVTVYEPSENFGGYVLLQEKGLVSYDRVIEVQRTVSATMAPFGGVCESWGILH